MWMQLLPICGACLFDVCLNSTNYTQHFLPSFINFVCVCGLYKVTFDNDNDKPTEQLFIPFC